MQIADTLLSPGARSPGRGTMMQPPSGPSPTDHFPSTPRSWLLSRLHGDARDRGSLNHRIMSIYAQPLTAYVRGSSFRDLGDAAELVNGFFASRLSNEDYLAAWGESGLTLRRWLMNGMLLFLHEEARRLRRDRRAKPLPDALAVDETAFERDYARMLVRQARDAARAQCEAGGLTLHWQAFEARHEGEGALAAFRERHGLTPGQTSHLVRAATARFRKALVELVLLDGASRDEADSEILRLMRSLQE